MRRSASTPALLLTLLWAGTVGAQPEVKPLPTKWPSDKQALHVLNRLAFGPSPSDLAEVKRVGVAGWIDAQLKPASVEDAAVEQALVAANLRVLSLDSEQLFAAFPNPKQEQMNDAAGKPAQVTAELAAAKLIRATASKRQLQEVLTDFWFNHFNVSSDKGAVKWQVVSYERDAIRPHLFGKFRALLGATAHHPAMLFYLDNSSSTVEGFTPKNPRPGKAGTRGLNENYARELMELHTLGVDGGYAQADVREVARAFTGWSNERRAGPFRFKAATHDRGEKKVLGRTLPEGRGIEDGEEVLDLLASHPATAKFISRKLAQRFVSDDPPQALVDALADVFTRSGGDLGELYAALFRHPSFWADSAYLSKTKTPLELAVSAIRALDGKTDGSRPLHQWISRMGMVLYRASPPTGYSDSAQAWVSAGALVTRINFGVQLTAGRIDGVQLEPPRPSLTPADEQVDVMAMQLLGRPLAEGTRAALLGAMEKVAGKEDPDEPRVDPRRLMGLLLGSPDFQKQ